MAAKTKQARTADADLLGLFLPARCGLQSLIKNLSLTQVKAALHGWLIHPEFAASLALIWAQALLGLKVHL